MAFTIKQKCDFLGELEKGEPTRAKDIGELIGLDAYNAGLLARDLRYSQLIEWTIKAKQLYRITEKGKKYKANPPAEIEAAPPAEIKPSKDLPAASSTVKGTEESTEKGTEKGTEVAPPQTLTPEEKPEAEKSVVFPSQADTFSSIGERLGFEKGVSDQKKPSLETVVEYVRSLANMDDLDSVEGVLTECGLSADIRKRWLRLYALTLPAKKAIISPELRVRLGLEEGEGKPKPPQQMYNVIEGKIYPDPDGDYTFSKAVQLVAAEKTSADPAALLTALMPILTKEAPQLPPSTDLAALITSLMPILNKETPPPPQQDTTLFQSLQARIEQLAEERNKAQLDALRAEMKAGQRPPEADAQIQALSQSIETMREELHTQQLERIKEQHEATMNLLTGKLAQLEQQMQASIQGKQVDSKYGLMSEGLKGILGEIGGARRDIKEIAPTFLQRGREKTVRTSEQKNHFDQGMEQAIESQKKSREMEDKLFFGKES